MQLNLPEHTFKIKQTSNGMVIFDVLRASYLIVSNGLQHYCCSIDYANNSYAFLKDIPNYDEICPSPEVHN